jgi:phosphoribosyl 1,2-cyclic phosphodiesterase
VKQLALFHHDPNYNDQKFLQIVQQARRCFENSIGAQEGWTLSL